MASNETEGGNSVRCAARLCLVPDSLSDAQIALALSPRLALLVSTNTLDGWIWESGMNMYSLLLLLSSETEQLACI